MQRTINHTGRKKIEAKELQIHSVHKENNSISFDVNFNLDKQDLPEDASVYIEAYYKNTLQRFYFGTVGKIITPANRNLDQIDLSGPTLFRIHIVDESQNIGRLIASADTLKPEGEDDEEQRSSLLPVKSRPLREQTWRVEFDTGGKPELCINNRIPDAIGQIKSNPVFQSLILPAVFRQILMFYIWDDADEENTIAEQWLGFAEYISGPRPEDNDPAVLCNWIDEVIDDFSKSFKLCEMLINKMENS